MGGNQAFIDNVFNLDKHRYDAMSWAISNNRTTVIEYILSMSEIKQKYLSSNDLLYHLVGRLNSNIKHKKGVAVKYVVDKLGLTEAKLTELRAFRQIDIEKIIPYTK